MIFFRALDFLKVMVFLGGTGKRLSRSAGSELFKYRKQSRCNKELFKYTLKPVQMESSTVVSNN